VMAARAASASPPAPSTFMSIPAPSPFMSPRHRSRSCLPRHPRRSYPPDDRGSCCSDGAAAGRR
jgi:hypothetical protein